MTKELEKGNASFEANNSKITWFCGLVSLTGLIIGFEVGTADQLINSPLFVQTYGHQSPAMVGFTVSCFNLGCIIGCVLGLALVRMKYHLIIKSGYLIYTVGVIINIINIHPHIGLFITYRIITGIVSGIFLLMSPIYMTKLTLDLNQRGKNLSLFQMNICLGILIGNILNYFMNSNLLQYLINGIIIVISLFSYYYLPAILSQETDLKNLKNFFENIDPTLIEETNLEVFNTTPSDGTGRFSWKKLGLCSTLMVLQPLTGINVFFYYSNLLFPNRLLIVGMPILNLLGSLLSIYIVQKFNRRSLLLGGSITLFFVYYIYEFTNHFIAIYLIILTFASTWGPISGIIMNELAIMHLPTLIISITGNFVMNFLLMNFSMMFIENNALTMIWLFEMAMMVSSSMFIKYLPETKDVSLEDIEMYFL